MLADSNLIIYAASGNYPNLVEWFAEKKPAVSAISLVETLGYHKLNAEDKAARGSRISAQCHRQPVTISRILRQVLNPTLH